MTKIRKSFALIAATAATLLIVGPLAAQSQSQTSTPRISKGGLKEEQRIIGVHVREARKDLDRAKMDLNGNRMRTAEVVIARTEVSLSKAGGLLEEHPVRIEKLKGLFVGESDRVDLRKSYDKLDNEYSNLEREFYTMVDEIGGGASRRSRMDFLKLISSAIPDLQETNKELATEMESLLSAYEACLKAGDNDCAREKLEALRDLYEKNKDTITKVIGKQVKTDNILATEPKDWPKIISNLKSADQKSAQDLLTIVQNISNPDDRLEAEKLYGDYLYALQQGDTAKAAQLEKRIRELAGAAATPANNASAPSNAAAKSRVVQDGNKTTFLDMQGRPIISVDSETIRDGKNTLPQAEYAGGLGKRITKEFDIIIDYDSGSQTFSVDQGNVKIWSLEVAEDPSQRVLESTLITSFELRDGGAVGDGYTVDSWVMTDENGNTLREGSGSNFRVEFSAPGTYRVYARGKTARGNSFEIGREYPITEGILE